MSKPPPPGVYVPAVIFFDEKEELDFASIKTHLLRLAKGGLTGILVQGSNGEAQHLSRDERKEVVKFTRDTLDEHGFQNIVVIAGTGALSTREAKLFCADAAEAGASHCLVLTPSVWPPYMTRERIIQYHREVADASPIPTMVYNIPVVTAGINLDSSIVIELSSHPNIVGTKLSCGDIGKLHRVTIATKIEEFVVFTGKSDVFAQSLFSGSAGVIGSLVNIAPKTHVRLWNLYKEGKVAEALEIQRVLGPADYAISRNGVIGGVKAVVNREFGYGSNRVREPLGIPDTKFLSGSEYDVFKAVAELERSL
ncbi:hypothetical protein HWV62_8677 [Athelia sp. TMB]|nr:hypothetical protein HWV62_8677 [Athelia sp. TMB]